LDYPPVAVKVWGDFACFTRPEMKVERVSYPVMTPSAARGVLEAIFWKPEFTWRVREIHVLKPIRHFSLMRNEVSQRASSRSDGLDITECRTQRHTLGLRDVAYLIYADTVVAPGVTEDAAKFRDQFRRRVDRGQCYHRPYLGCREFAASFAAPAGSEQPVDITEPLGLMLLDVEYREDGVNVPHFFRAQLKHGVLRVPDEAFKLMKGGSA
jgi:CRISPR-associated protein Cas5d